MGWCRIGHNMYEWRTRRGRSMIIYVQEYRGGYAVNYGQAPKQFVIRETEAEAIEDMETHKRLVGGTKKNATTRKV